MAPWRSTARTSWRSTPRKPWPPGITGREVVDTTDDIVVPGLVNTHGHAPMVLYRGLADDLALMDWLQRYIFPAEAKTVSPEMVRVGTRLAALEMIQSGTTTFTDMYYFEEEIARTARDAGLRGVLGETIIKFPVADAKTPAESLAARRSVHQEFRHDPLITPAVAPHSAYTLERTRCWHAAISAVKYGVPMLMHVAETEDEVRIIREASTPDAGRLSRVDRLLGAARRRRTRRLGERRRHRDPERRGVGVSHNPESNMKLASGVAPVPKYLAAGVASSASARTAPRATTTSTCSRRCARPRSSTSSRPTIRARCRHRGPGAGDDGRSPGPGPEDAIGSLEPAKRADVIVVGTNRARQTPLYDPSLAAGLRHPRRRREDDDRQRSGVDARPEGRSRWTSRAVLAEARRLAVQVRQAVTPQ